MSSSGLDVRRCYVAVKCMQVIAQNSKTGEEWTYELFSIANALHDHHRHSFSSDTEDLVVTANPAGTYTCTVIPRGSTFKQHHLSRSVETFRRPAISSIYIHRHVAGRMFVPPSLVVLTSAMRLHREQRSSGSMTMNLNLLWKALCSHSRSHSSS